jgi:c-di-GMP-binding flagellar brake protein YcgR
MVTGVVLQRHHRRDVFRFALDLPLTVSIGSVEAQARTTDVSASGLGWISERWYGEGQKVQVSLRTRSSELPIVSTADVAVCRRISPGKFKVGAVFTDMSAESERRLILTLFQAVAPTSVSLPAAGWTQPEAA